MADIHIRVNGRAGRITLTRDRALNALSLEMCREIDAALSAWAEDAQVAVVLIDAAGERAFCAGGDIQEIYETGLRGDYAYGRSFWADEYRMNARIAAYPKPVVTLMQGYTVGGGVGLGCHASHRVVCETSQIALPEVAIGLVPDVGGSVLLARAPGHAGEYLGATAARMGPGDAILAGFADAYVPREFWLDLETRLEDAGDAGIVAALSETPPPGPVEAAQVEIDALFALPRGEIEAALDASDTAFARGAREALGKASPLAVACGLENIRAVRAGGEGIAEALAREYRFTWRASEFGDFLEGIRAKVIDKDGAPRWRHGALASVPQNEIDRMLAPLGENELRL
ncbi:MAG: enoyl-CoA hydratase/isomerase family protein [Maritimibacter sp.]|nr:enoyl-CoA hydratase/isomerase family protein [Maritimibacter sp.]